uniref:Uncharacterized protein n=1 Tax=Angiostrongylus cantonensis TaxID=6313 RepID=A0A0K0DB96_ANGCA
MRRSSRCRLRSRTLGEPDRFSLEESFTSNETIEPAVSVSSERVFPCCRRERFLA